MRLNKLTIGEANFSTLLEGIRIDFVLIKKKKNINNLYNMHIALWVSNVFMAIKLDILKL